MPSALRLSDGSYMRQTDIERIIEWLYSSRCVEVTGFSNVGKSALMRLLAHGDVWLGQLGEEGSAFLPVYIDCNRMLEMTEQGFYELVLRCLQESSPILAEDGEVGAAYEALVAPANVFQVPLSFNIGLTAALQNSVYKLILLFDEFEEPFQQLDSRVFLNLRARKDRYGSRLVYVTATVWPLAELRPGEHSSEFCELFMHQPWHLAPLSRHDVKRYIRNFAERNSLVLSSADVDFVYHWTGGHPGYLAGVSRILSQAIAALEQRIVDGSGPMLQLDTAEGEGAHDRWILHRGVVEQLRKDPTLNTESKKIWQSCAPGQQETLRSLSRPTAARNTTSPGVDANRTDLAMLAQRHILVQVNAEQRAFCRLFAEYLQTHQSDDTDAASDRFYLDDVHGEIFVDGRQVETLTRLEYHLMKLLYENSNKIVDKYQIVVGVWGEDYLEDVDDARIEKLISRLRQKVEPDPGNPVFITTVRGRGYRLLLA